MQEYVQKSGMVDPKTGKIDAEKMMAAAKGMKPEQLAEVAKSFGATDAQGKPDMAKLKEMQEQLETVADSARSKPKGSSGFL